MELTKKAAIGVAAGAVISVVATAVITWVITTSSTGMDAAEKARIIAVLKEHQQLDDGRSVKEALSSLDKNYAVLATDVENIDENVDLIRQAVQAIAEDQ